MFSIVIPLYNKEHTIFKTINSVLNQTFTDFELIVVNDGSTDNGIEVIKKTLNDSRIKIVEQTNQGVSVARNKGVSEAKFEHIAFLDADDEWLPSYLEKMKHVIDLNPNAGLFCCAGIVKHSNGTSTLRLAKKYKNKVLEVNFFENPHVFLHTSATIVSKKDFNKTEGFPIGMKRNQDFALFFTLALITQTIYCGIPLSVYVGGIDGQATSTSSNLVLEHISNRFNLVFKNWLKTNQQNLVFIIFMKYELRHIIISYLREKDYKNMNIFLGKLSPDIFRLFPNMEMAAYPKHILRSFNIFYILITKIIWRMRGYPRVS